MGLVRNILSAVFSEGNKRELQGWTAILFIVLAFSLSLYQIWSVTFSRIDPINQMAIHLSFILALTFLSFTFSKKVKRDGSKWIDLVFMLLAIAAGIYYTLEATRIAVRTPQVDSLSNLDIFFGLVFVLLVIEATRRTIGIAIIIVATIFIAYTLWGHHLFGLWYHRYLSPTSVLDLLAFSLNGLWGSPIAVAASFVFIFVLFGSFLQKSGAGEFFFDLSKSLAGGARGGAAKVAIFASAFFGTISGSPTANVVTTGTFTIPMSIKTGYRPSFAAAVEAASSTGGSLLPPVMGSAAFLMVAVTGIPYGSIAVAAAIPAVLFFVALYYMVHFEAIKLDLPRTPRNEVPKLSKVLKEGWFYFIPLVVLVVLLLQGYSPSRTGVYAILAVILVSWFRKDTRMGLKKITEAMIDGAKTSIPVSTACAAAGLVIAGIVGTGLGGKVNSIVLGLTQGMLVPSLILIMVMCIIIGLGMPVAAAYILTAMLAAPTLINMGVSVMAAHLFVVYFAAISAITPPVAVAAFAAAGIAGTNPNRVSIEAVRLAITAFIVPFMFVLNPALLMYGNPLEIILSFITASIGVIALGAGVIGWFMIGTNIVERILLILGGLMMVSPGIITYLIGVSFILITFIMQRKRKVTVEEQSITV